ncbi:MAG TPA: sulfatase-like hydrolase/transferase [Blastocatellia bacterium]|nr:sulfatase-like hydrolase/transferase [Blastocatellia bacterium]
MKALALFGVLVIAKLAMLAGRPIRLSGWELLAYFWQDALIAFAFWLVDQLLERTTRIRATGWAVYGIAVLYVAINVPVARVLSSPLTWPMLGATRGALSDSIRHHATAENIWLMMLVAAAGVVLPLLLRWADRRFEWRTHRAIGVSAATLASLIVIVLGPLATARVDTAGMGRNAVTALATTMMPRITAGAANPEPAVDWRTTPIDASSLAEDISNLRAGASGRNVVLIVLESAGARYLRPYGAAVDPMPNLSELAATSLIFDNAYSVYPESIKGLFAVLCSRYPAMDTKAESYARITTPSIAAALRDKGYRTALFHSGRFMYLGMEEVVNDRGFEVLEDAGTIGGNRESSFGVDEPSTVRRALAWIDTLSRGERFFLTYLPIAGHHPYETPGPGPFIERTESDRYLNALHYADESLGALIEGLRERGLDQRTLFVIFGDHGEAFGQHDGNYGHSLFLYEENIRVPYLIAAPGLMRQQTRITRPISLIDTAPTILDLLGLPKPDGHQGLAALDGRSNVALFYTDYSLSLMGMRDGCWKYIYELESGRSKLYDACSDAEESRDLSSSEAKRTDAYRAHLLNWASAQKALINGSSDAQ